MLKHLYSKLLRFKQPKIFYKHEKVSKKGKNVYFGEKLIFTNTNPTSFVDLSLTQDAKYLLINVNNRKKSKIFIFNGIFKFELDFHNEFDEFYLQSNNCFAVVYTKDFVFNLIINRDLKNEWKFIYKFNENEIVNDFYVLREKILVLTSEFGVDYISLIDFNGNRKFIDSKNAFCFSFFNNFLLYENPISFPKKIHLPKEKLDNLNENFIFDNLQPVNGLEHVSIESMMIESVPVTIINPQLKSINTLISVYGAYGHNHKLNYRPEWIPLLLKDWKIVVVHVQGGSEKGLKWHLEGTGSKKMDSIKTFVKIIHQIDSKQKSVHAFSAGALIAASAFCLDPNLFDKIILRSPFLDIKKSIKDQNDKLSQMELKEFRETASPMELIKKSPLKNVKILISASRNDLIVPFYHSIGWIDQISKLENVEVLTDFDDFNGHFEGKKCTKILEKEVDFLMDF